MTLTQLSQKRAIDLTGEELAEIILHKISPEIIRPKKILRGNAGIAEALGDICIRKAIEIKNAGIINDAICEDGRNLFVDAELASDLYFKHLQSIKKGFRR